MKGKAAAALVFAAIIAAWATMPVFAVETEWFASDTCDHGSGPNATGSQPSSYFLAEGPTAYWSDYPYDGGPTNAYAPTGWTSCSMWTYVEATWSGTQVGNDALWYLCVNPTSADHGCTGNYYLYQYIPPNHSNTNNAQYQIWETGHKAGAPAYTCSVKQNPVYSQWVQLANYAGTSCSPSLGSSQSVNMCGEVDSSTGTSCGAFMYLDDATGETTSSEEVAFDEGAFCPYDFTTQECPVQDGGGGGFFTGGGGGVIPQGTCPPETGSITFPEKLC